MSYTYNNIKNALSAIYSGKTFKEVSEEFNIPESTIRGWSYGKSPDSRKALGELDIKWKCSTSPIFYSLDTIVDRMRKESLEHSFEEWSDDDTAYDILRRLFVKNVLLWGGQPIPGIITDDFTYRYIRDGKKWLQFDLDSRLFAEMTCGLAEYDVYKIVIQDMTSIAANDVYGLDISLTKEGFKSDSDHLVGFSMYYDLKGWNPDADVFCIPRQHRVYAYQPYDVDEENSSFVYDSEVIKVPEGSIIQPSELEVFHVK